MNSDLKIQNVVIIGGGTAGYMSAAALARTFGDRVNITIIESETIGIIGVGEATIPPIKLFNAMLGISEQEFMRETKASFKLGIRFKNWGGLGEDYFHPFGVYGLRPEMGPFPQFLFKLQQEGHNLKLEDYSLCTIAAKFGKMDAQSQDSQSAFSTLGSAYHFDAILYANFLRKYCEKRGVRRIEAIVTQVNQDPMTGHINSVETDKQNTIDGDLFIDCTGFKGLLIEETLKSGYSDWSHWLPVNRAVAVPCENVKDIVPYTISTAHEAGWQWRIPLQHRIGNGYVFSDHYTPIEQATQLLMNNLDAKPLAEPRVLKFTTGRRKAFWAKNVVAIGLASGFLEPLESTSIHLIQSGINKLLQHWPDKNWSPANIDYYNKKIGNDFEHIRDFIILHYHATKRDDAPMWQYVKNMKVPQSLLERIERFKERGTFSNTPDEMFTTTSWLAVLMGQNITPVSHDPLIDLYSSQELINGFATMKEALYSLEKTMPSHNDYLAQTIGGFRN